MDVSGIRLLGELYRNNYVLQYIFLETVFQIFGNFHL